MIRHFTIAAFSVLSILATTGAARADELSVVRGQFTDKVENRLPVGDASSLGAQKTVTYWLEVNSPNEATQVTLVWKLDGKEVARQSLDVGRAPHWRTWGMCGTRTAHSIEVEVLDKDGHSLKTDATTIAGS
jgi:hypothetical protein